MNDRVDPSQLPEADELDLGQYQSLQVSDHTPRPSPRHVSLIEQAVSRLPLVPPALHEVQNPDPRGELDLATAVNLPLGKDHPLPDVGKITIAPQEEKQPGRFTKFLKSKKPAPDAAEEKSKKPLFSRRNVLLGGLGAAGAYYGVRSGIGWLNAGENYNFALLRNEDGHMGLIHRQFSVDDTQGMIDPSVTQKLSENRVAANGLESIVVSPEIELEALSKNRHPSEEELQEMAKHKHDRQEIEINGTARNIYIPYHLFENAARFNVVLRTHQEILPWGDGKLKPNEHMDAPGGKKVRVAVTKKLVISIAGRPEAEDVPITEDIATGATNVKDAVGDKLTGFWNGITTLPDQIAEATGLGDGINEAEVAAQKAEKARLAREGAKPKPTAVPRFSIVLDYEGDGKLPDLQFYNGRTLGQPTYSIKREDLAKGIRQEHANDTPGMHLITNNREVSTPDGGVRRAEGIRYVDTQLEKAAHGASGKGNTGPTNGFVKDAWNGLKEITWEDDELSKKESAALVMTTKFQHEGLRDRQKCEEGMFTAIAGDEGRGAQTIANRFADRISGEPDHEVGR